MPHQVRLACPLDCFDACGLVATVADGRVVKIQGDRNHPLTRGAICAKGRQLLTRTYHPQRLTRPLRRIKGRLRPVEWEEALATFAAELRRTREAFGPPAVLHYSDSGYGGLIKTVDEMFFNYFGGATVPVGSLCWGAGIAAQKYDFGQARGHAPEDIARARTLILWGRNPADTNLHLAAAVCRARKAGAKVYVIDPLRTASCRLADVHLPVRPATDGALALAMARVMIAEDLLDHAFVDRRVKGFEAFRAYVEQFTPRRAAALTGIPAAVIVDLARTYARRRPACIVIGYGLQRHRHGGNTVRCIDALGALSGNIGRSGGGVNYANRSLSPYIGGELARSRKRRLQQRTFRLPRLGAFLEKAGDPPVRAVCVAKANPLVQMPALNRTVEAFSRVPFKVVIDMFMTDTARHADLVLPCTSVLEEEDIIFTNMFSPYLNYSHRAVAPPPGVLSEYALFMELARRLGITDYPDIPAEEFLRRAVAPLLQRFGIEFEQLQTDYFHVAEDAIPWADGRFATPSGKFELYSENARRDGLSALPLFTPPAPPPENYPLRLITPHCRSSMHSQNFAFATGIPDVHASPAALAACGLAAGDAAAVLTPRGRLTARVKPDPAIPDGVAMIYQGWWHRSGSVNRLTADTLTDMGDQAAYYDCYCRLEPTAKQAT